MNHKIEELENKIKIKMHEIGYEVEEVLLNPSNRPDLGDYQYNGAMALAKTYHDNPMNIAGKIVDEIKVDNPEFQKLELFDLDTFRIEKELFKPEETKKTTPTKRANPTKKKKDNGDKQS